MQINNIVKLLSRRPSWSLLVSVFVIILASSLVGSTRTLRLTFAADPPIPTQSDWTDYGPIFESGDLGEWDYILWGGFAGTAVKKDGVYYLYYQGVSGYQITPDETVTGRSIGVATSPDGINFTKFSSNPVITWSPNTPGNDSEEGAVSGGVTLDVSGDMVMYYGANTAFSPTQVNADGRLATSADGFTFTDHGVVLDHTDGSVWGSGDELFPVIAFQDAGQWFVYYIPNGAGTNRTLGATWGNARNNLSNSAAALSGGASVKAWGMGGKAKVGPDTYALFINDAPQSKIEVRIMSLSTPDHLSAPAETYQFDEVDHATVLLDKETNTWFMYYQSEVEYGVKLAPAGTPDTTPPTAPTNVVATPISDRQIDLSWDPATDAETGIVLYNVFRDGLKVATVKGWSFTDTGLVEQTDYNYEISAVNYHGVEGPRSTPVSATTLGDVTPPGIVSVNASGNPHQVTVVFDEPVEQASAETAANYLIDYGISVVSASLAPDLKTVSLTTSEHSNGTYRIFVNNVRDWAERPNSIAPGSMVNYTYNDTSGLVGAWTFDEGRGETAFDTANYGNDGGLIYTDKPGPIWTTGQIGGALQFDGTDDQVTIDGSGSLENVTDGSHSFAAWVNPGDIPPNATANEAFYSVLVRKYTGLYYDYDGKFKAQIRLADGTQVEVSSAVFDPGTWHYLTMVVDDVNRNLQLYVDGQEVSASPVSYSGALADHEDAPYYIGTSEPLTELYEYRFKGLIDEAWIFSQSLTATEVEALFAGFSDYLAPVTAATVQVSADPTMIVANQVATATVTAVVRDDAQMPLPDGRVVQFTTSKGALANGGLATTGGGQGEAAIVLTSAATSGLAEITATIDSVSGSTTVEMLSPTPLLSVSVTAGQTMIAIGGLVTYSYTVANGGDVALSEVTVVDDNGSPDNPGDDITLAACNNVSLVIGEAKDCGTRTATLNQTTVNTVNATGKDLVNNTVTATDSITIMVVPDTLIFLPLVVKAPQR